MTVSGGVILITTCLPEAISSHIWMTQLNMKISERFNKHNPSLEQFDKIFKVADLSLKQKLNLIGSGISNNYFNYEGPLDEAWRNTSSYWTFATLEDLEDVKRKVLELKSKGELEKWAKDHDHSDTAGVITLLICSNIS